ncbi:MAG: ribonuclease PH [Promicromonosporaceae bacterium]|nr:ribonuclease PH [Promicromonosporaceae bacterium]
MKRQQVIKRLREAAKAAGLEFREVELTNHTGIVVGDFRSIIGRHREISEVTVKKFFKQYESVLGEGWWQQ